MDDAGQVEEDAKDDIKNQGAAYTCFEEDRHKWKKNREDNHQDFVIAYSHSTNLLKSNS